MKLITLTQIDSNKILVNTRHIVCIQSMKDGSTGIQFSTRWIYVKESLNQIIKKARGEQ